MTGGRSSRPIAWATSRRASARVSDGCASRSRASAGPGSSCCSTASRAHSRTQARSSSSALRSRPRATVSPLEVRAASAVAEATGSRDHPSQRRDELPIGVPDCQRDRRVLDGVAVGGRAQPVQDRRPRVGSAEPGERDECGRPHLVARVGPPCLPHDGERAVAAHPAEGRDRRLTHLRGGVARRRLERGSATAPGKPASASAACAGVRK